MPSDSSDIDFGATIRAFAPEQRVFSRFVLTRLLGRGGMGVVWLAEDEKLEREVALKFLPEAVALDPRSVDDLKRETRRSLELTHPHIVRIYDFFEDDMAAAISMEYVEGGSLAKIAVEQPLRCFEPVQILPWIRQLVDALEYAHNKAKIVHRDLKPANLMVTDSGDLKITDFGISATVTDSMTRVSRLASSGATPAYSSPQQVMGERPSPADDIYSLGASIFDLITGKPPFHSGNLLVQVQTKQPDTMGGRREELDIKGSEIPENWERTIGACLNKEQSLRPASPRAVLVALEGGELVLAGNNAGKTRTKSVATPAVAIADASQQQPPSTVDPAATVPIRTHSTVPPTHATGGGSTPPPQPPERFDGLGDRVKRIIAGKEGRGAQVAALMVPVVALILLLVVLLWPKGEPEIAFNEPVGGQHPVAQPQDSFGQTQPQAPGQQSVEQTPAAVATQSPQSGQDSFTQSGSAQAQPSTTEPRTETVRRPAPPSQITNRSQPSVSNQPQQPQSRQPAITSPPERQEQVRASSAPPPMPVTGTVEITSSPSGASVIAEGREIGRTPLALPAIRPGPVEYSIRLSGHEEAIVSGRVVANETIRLNSNLKAIAQKAAANREITVPDLNLNLVWLEPGEFVLGSPQSESGPDSDEQPQTRVRFAKGFWVARTEVTQAQYRMVMGGNPSQNTRAGEHAPVDSVSWNDAMAFCSRLNAREQKAGRVPDGYAYQLPSEVQWEYACRAGTTGPYAGEIRQIGVVGRKSSGSAAVGSLRPNAWGLYDMHGNVSEWTRSWYGPYPGGTVDDFAGPASGRVRVFRGGAYDSPARSVRSAYRGYVSGSGEDENRGFRVVLAPTS